MGRTFNVEKENNASNITMKVSNAEIGIKQK